MAKIDLHKLALTVGFEVVCVDDDFTNYEYMVRIRDIESMSYVLKIKNHIEYSDFDNIVSSIVVVLPADLRRKVWKLSRKREESNVDNIVDLLCYTIAEYRSKTSYSLLKEYGDLVGVDIESHGYYFTYNLPKKKYNEILSLIESKLSIEEAPIVGRLKKIEYKIGYMKQSRRSGQN
ncbi:MAG: hypothetical protein IJ538_02475 [Clostridia bacterium]|nr:hypothetical protein [Clostridia bacterium]